MATPDHDWRNSATHANACWTPQCHDEVDPSIYQTMRTRYHDAPRTIGRIRECISPAAAQLEQRMADWYNILPNIQATWKWLRCGLCGCHVPINRRTPEKCASAIGKPKVASREMDIGLDLSGQRSYANNRYGVRDFDSRPLGFHLVFPIQQSLVRLGAYFFHFDGQDSQARSHQKRHAG